MDLVQAIFGLAALFLIMTKVLLMYLAYRLTFKVEATARAREAKRRQLEAIARLRKVESEELEREEATRAALVNIKNSLRKNFELVGAVVASGSVSVIIEKLIEA